MARPSPRDAIGLFDLSPTNLEVDSRIPGIRSPTCRSRAVRDREIDPKQYYPPDMYREPQPDFPNGFKIDVREIAATKARHIQAKLAEKQAQLQQVVDASSRLAG